MYAYGAYGGVNEVEFDANLFSLLDRGWVYAFAHIRGDADMVRIAIDCVGSFSVAAAVGAGR